MTIFQSNGRTEMDLTLKKYGGGLYDDMSALSNIVRKNIHSRPVFNLSLPNEVSNKVSTFGNCQISWKLPYFTIPG